MDRLETMTSFVEVAKQGSFSSAANQLRLSRALVSRHIQDLEEHLGARLLNRTTRSVTLTEAGNRYFEFCSRMLEELSAEEGSLRKAQDKPEGVLKIIAPVWFGSLDIGGIIGDFVATNPRVKINLVLGGFGTRQFRFLDEGFDLSIHTRELPVSTLVARRLGFISWKLCASPSYLSRTKELESLDELQQHACLVHNRDNPWRFRSGSRSIVVKTNPLVTSNSYLPLRLAAIRGLGISMLPSAMVDEDIRARRLVPVLSHYPLPVRPLSVAYSPGGRLPAKTDAFIKHLVKSFRSMPL